MSRSPSSTDFPVDVPGIGQFIFARRTIQDSYRIRGNYNALTNGSYDTDGNVVDFSALGFVTVQALVVTEPDGFDLGALDPLVDDDFDDKVVAVFKALREKELSFRPKPVEADKGSGAGESVQPGGVVSA